MFRYIFSYASSGPDKAGVNVMVVKQSFSCTHWFVPKCKWQLPSTIPTQIAVARQLELNLCRDACWIMWPWYGVHVTVCMALLVCVLCQPVRSLSHPYTSARFFFRNLFMETKTITITLFLQKSLLYYYYYYTVSCNLYNHYYILLLPQVW